MRIATYDSLIERVTFLGSLNGQIGVGERHEPTDVGRELNAANRAQERMVTDRGFRFYVESTTPANLPAVDTDFDWREVAWDSAYGSVEGVDFELPGGNKEWDRLDYVAWEQRHLWAGQGYPYPRAYTVRDVATAAADGAVLLLPAGDAGGRFVLHYLPTHTDIASGGSFRFLCGPCEDWVVADTVLRLIGTRDGDSGTRVQSAREMRATAEELIGKPSTMAVPESVAVEMEGRRRGWQRRGFVRR